MPDDDAAAAAVELRPWSPDDLDLMTALLGDPAMTEHLGGPESAEQLRRRIDKYLAMTPADGRMFVITLGPLRLELYPLHQTWLNDPEVAWNVFGAAVQRSFEDERAWIEQYLADPMTRLWLIYRLDEARPIGVTAVTEIDAPAGTGTFRMFIGAARDRGQGFGGEASELVIRHGFEDLGLREIQLSVFGYNAPAMRLYERLGFREVERHPMQHERDGRRWDVIRMARQASPSA